MQVQSTEAFQQAYQQLNPQQRQAVDTIEGPVMVIAGPGTGKTQMLAMRIANILLKTDTQPHNILALTFTEAGVIAMRQRLVKLIGPVGHQVNIFTFHGFSRFLIQSHPEIFSEFIQAKPTQDLDQIEIITSILDQTTLEQIKPINAPHLYLKSINSAIDNLKREHITPEEFELALDQQKKDLDQDPDAYHQKGAYKGKMKTSYKNKYKHLERNYELAQVYREYQSELNKRSLYDFADMINIVVARMESDQDFLLGLQEEYQYLLVDEHQDTNRAQNQLILNLTSFHQQPNVFVVGDHHQAIYRFQGASLTNFLKLQTNYPDLTLITLAENYRSTQPILDQASQLMTNISDLEQSESKQLLAQTDRQHHSINFNQFPSIEAELSYLSQQIKADIESGVEPSQILVAVRQNQEIKLIEPYLQAAGIPYQTYTKRNVLEQPTTQKLEIILKTIYNFGDDQLLHKFMLLDLNQIHPYDLFQLKLYLNEHRDLKLWDLIFKESIIDQLELIQPESVKKVRYRLESWHELVHNQTADVGFATIARQSGLLEQIMTNPKFYQAVDDLSQIYQLVKQGLEDDVEFSLKDLLNKLDLMQQHNLGLSGNDYTGDENKVSLMTAHGTKGLEFEHVYLPMFNSKRWEGRSNLNLIKLPLDYLDIDQTGSQYKQKQVRIQDERRLFFVVLTRAKQKLSMSYSQFDDDQRSLEQSQYIKELDQDLIKSDDQLVEFLEQFETEHQKLTPILYAGHTSNTDIDPDKLMPIIFDLLKKQGVSATSLNNYLECPWKFFFSNILRIPQEKTTASKFGSIVHQAIHQTITSSNLDSDNFQKNFLLAFDDQYLTQMEKESLLNKHQESLLEWYQSFVSQLADKYKSEVNIKRVGYTDEIHLTGKLDLVEFLDKNNHVRVTDFKTGKPKSDNEVKGLTQNSNGNYYRQLVFYKLLLQSYRQGQWQMESGVINFVTPKESGKFISRSFVISDEDVINLKTELDAMITSVSNLDFWTEFCEDPDCEYCQLRRLM